MKGVNLMLWTDNDFDSLPRLGELYTLAEFKENVCEGETFIDSAPPKACTIIS